ncbi:MAG: helix-hairpin-helix domain-containing protein [Thermomicrobiales bacterium]
MNITIPVAHISKEDVAEVLIRTATILDIAGDNPYRSLAYRRAARLVLATAMPLPAYLTARGFLDLPGLGVNLRRKLGDLVITGCLRFGLEIMARLPDAASALMAIPSIGPNSARRLHDELGISTVDDAIAAARAGQIRTLHGFGRRKEELILEGALRVQSGMPKVLAFPRPELDTEVAA